MTAAAAPADLHYVVPPAAAVPASLRGVDPPAAGDVTPTSGDVDGRSPGSLDAGSGAPGPTDRESQGESDCDEAEDTTAVALPAPPRPTPQMVADHQVAHIPFRSWCPACVRGRAPT